MAPYDLKRALALEPELGKKDWEPSEWTLLRITWRLAEINPAEAAKQAEAVSRTAFRTMARAGLAPRLAPRDPKLAHSLIDRAFDLCLDSPDEFVWMNYGGRSTVAALVAYHARLAGYPDRASVVARVLACRPTENQTYSAKKTPDTLVRTATLLSLTDPVAARMALEQVAPPDQPIPTELADCARD